MRAALQAVEGIETETLERDSVHIGIRTVATEARADAAEALLVEMVKDCPDCGGGGIVYMVEDETEYGQSPGSSGAVCNRCTDARAFLEARKP